MKKVAVTIYPIKNFTPDIIKGNKVYPHRKYKSV